MTDKPRATLDFDSKEEFRAACRALSGRMHYLNRVAMGESRFSWEVADILERLGQVFERHYEDKEVQAAFGDGYDRGTFTDDERRAYLFKLLYDGK